MITLQDWAEIRHLHGAEQMSVRAIASRLGISRDTVSRALAVDGPPKYVRGPVDSTFDGFEVRVRGLLRDFPQMPATVIAERVGWSGSSSWFRKKVALLRPEYAPADPADRIVYSAGDQAQCDLWFPPVKIPVGGSMVSAPPVLVVVSSFSKFITARMIPTRTTADLLSGMWSLLSTQLGAVPRRLIWDNEAGIGRRNNLAHGVAGFCGTLATKLQQLKAYDPESKGGVERANGYLETSFMPGRSFESPADFNNQLLEWLPKANSRTVRSLRARPVDLLEVDTAAMLRLPPLAPAHGFTARVRLPRDYYVRVAGNDYSVDPTEIGRMVEVTADLQRVQVRFGGKVVADHARSWGNAATITDPEHVITARRLREAFQQPRPVPVSDEGLVRDLADYDTAFGVTIEVAS
ncbi:MAG: IS21 family transposase [Kineosporiaceae bacterium]|nr:IS21 family transposase [Aeromicrobium sp.]